ncbi:cytosolic purine 5'-nucleotidase-like [Argonauta hians]
MSAAANCADVHSSQPQDALTFTAGDAHRKTKFRRDPTNRIFVNRSLNLKKIEFFGFDMDYTLAVYKSPAYESLCFEELKLRLLDIGYPREISEFKYDPRFPVRGLWFDKTYGNLLKVDSYGNILVCVHGFKYLEKQEITKLYSNKFIQLDSDRCYVFNTLFNLAEIYMLACLVDYFSNSNLYQKTDEGVNYGNQYMSYTLIFDDIRAAVDWLYLKSSLKEKTTNNLEKYVERDERLPVLLNRIQEHGAQNLLITNSEYTYTDKIMKYLLETGQQESQPDKPCKKWIDYFDYVVVSARKPAFFKEGSILRKIDKSKGSLNIGYPIGPIEKGQIYSGGSCSDLSRMIGASGKDVLYIGDHIYGDILKSKKERGWRTFLVIPELQRELNVWTEKKPLFEKINNLEVELSNIYKNLDSSSVENPDSKAVRKSLKEVTHEMDLSYGLLGSLFRSGSQQTFFASQVMRYADLYAASITNLLSYPFCYSFLAPRMLMSHESTVNHNDWHPSDDHFVSRSQPESASHQTLSPALKRSKLNSGRSSKSNNTKQTGDRSCDPLAEDSDDDDDDEEEEE